MNESDEIQTAIYQERDRYKEQDMESPTPYDINNGLCRLFARDVRKRLAFPVIIESVGFNCPKYPAHAWVAHDGRFYDAETPEGTNQRTELSHFQRNGIDKVEKEYINRI